ncbi:13422_t:CDS:2 [Entrophospora sp. SA101]|nr:13422_t:CDS:2 [Entrophospora sp. SA101]
MYIAEWIAVIPCRQTIRFKRFINQFVIGRDNIKHDIDNIKKYNKY